MTWIVRILREPLVHFVAIGGLVFALYYATRPDQSDPDRIVISEAAVQMLANQFESTWRRPPTSAELAGIVDSYVKEEILVREAMKLSMDQNDTVIRRRLAQKMEFLIDSIATSPAPTEEELRAYFQDNIQRFTAAPRMSFEQVYLGETATAEAVLGAVERLEDGTDPASVSRSTMLPVSVDDAREPEIDGTFGRGFFAALVDAEPGAWMGPVASGYGVHAVRLVEVDVPPAPEFEAVQAAVEAEWRQSKADELAERRFDQLRGSYQVELPELAAPGS
ncbi:peptidyl-prolyl cis-trans isomerase [Ruegeria sediminis]|uniref:peptidylprolyl isomerase n=1 Tax=Ruegeria sediminis TaxID=2583820 RepID=A0ABY2X2J9_9RHOB|nr:peptidylprolyl isomerase [Ruegeria sediminis]TMV08926.1 peptidyl-prolyl cis-trans isomerase [Ruegeria sediminis]